MNSESRVQIFSFYVRNIHRKSKKMRTGGFKAAPRNEVMKFSDLREYDLDIYARIKFDRALPPYSKERDRSITRLRRAGFVKNNGSRAYPQYIVLK